MTALRLSVESLLSSPNEAVLAEVIAEHVRNTSGYRPSPSEVKSWQRSLPALARDLADAGLRRVEMLVEYKLPLTSKRVDVVLAGVHPRTGEDSYVVVELKQWSRAEPSELGEHLVIVDGMPGCEKLNPAEQVRRYCEYMCDFLGVLNGRPDAVHGVAYLHNAMDMDVAGLAEQVRDERSRLFTKQQRGAFLRYLSERLSDKPGAEAADRLLTSAVAPSKQLMSHASKEIREREQFTLLDEQKVAFDIVMRAVEKARRADFKQVVIVTGGPGSGKSVIALSLLGELFRQGYSALHATGSQSFTQTMRRYPGRGSTRIKNLFRYFNSFIDAEPNALDVLICDEAHRIRETSTTRFTPAAKRTGRSQLDELLSAARVPVFLLDEHQVVRPGELGTVESIERYARSKGYGVHVISLNEQFRCGGSRKYERWVLRLLGLADGGPIPWDGDEDFVVRLAESPHELEAFLRAQTGTARMTAGYCWPWSDPRPDHTQVRVVPEPRQTRIGGHLQDRVVEVLLLLRRQVDPRALGRDQRVARNPARPPEPLLLDRRRPPPGVEPRELRRRPVLELEFDAPELGGGPFDERFLLLARPEKEDRPADQHQRRHHRHPVEEPALTARARRRPRGRGFRSAPVVP